MDVVYLLFVGTGGGDSHSESAISPLKCILVYVTLATSVPSTSLLVLFILSDLNQNFFETVCALFPL